MTTDETTVKHPATYSPQILTTIRGVLEQYLPILDERASAILDPFAGIGTIHQLDWPWANTYAIELEPEWAHISADYGPTWCGDWLKYRAPSAIAWPLLFDAVVTSPCYGNRMADHHNAKDTSTRRTYRHVLGRELTPGNSGGMQWGPEYRHFHNLAWAKVRRTLPGGGLFVLNIKNHVRKGK